MFPSSYWHIANAVYLLPCLFVIFISDLNPPGNINHLTKYADDATRLVPEKTEARINDEFQNIMKWASQNKLAVDMGQKKRASSTAGSTHETMYLQIKYRVLNTSYLSN